MIHQLFSADYVDQRLVSDPSRSGTKAAGKGSVSLLSFPELMLEQMEAEELRLLLIRLGSVFPCLFIINMTNNGAANAFIWRRSIGDIVKEWNSSAGFVTILRGLVRICVCTVITITIQVLNNNCGFDFFISFEFSDSKSQELQS